VTPVDAQAAPLAAVITVSYNSSSRLPSWLEAIEATGCRDRLELCVVDSGSETAERERLERDVRPHVDHLLLEPNRGFGRNSNRGVAATTAPVLIFANPDTRLDTLPTALFGDWPPGLLVGAMNHTLDPPGAQGCRRVPTAGWQALDMTLGRFSPPVYERDAVAPTWISGSSLAVSRDDFMRAGGFPEDLFLFFEDLELCLAHRRRGGRVAIDSQWAIRHPAEHGPLEARDSLDAIARQSGRWFARRHQGPLRAALLYFVLAAFYAPRRCAGVLLRRAGGRPAPTSALGLGLDLLFPSRVRRRLRAQP
jgi:GT2 family glycosyltransferase